VDCTYQIRTWHFQGNPGRHIALVEQRDFTRIKRDGR
jgi:hypothetical protein